MIFCSQFANLFVLVSYKSETHVIHAFVLNPIKFVLKTQRDRSVNDPFYYTLRECGLNLLKRIFG